MAFSSQSLALSSHIMARNHFPRPSLENTMSSTYTGVPDYSIPDVAALNYLPPTTPETFVPSLINSASSSDASSSNSSIYALYEDRDDDDDSDDYGDEKKPPLPKSAKRGNEVMGKIKISSSSAGDSGRGERSSEEGLLSGANAMGMGTGSSAFAYDYFPGLQNQKERREQRGMERQEWNGVKRDQGGKIEVTNPNFRFKGLEEKRDGSAGGRRNEIGKNKRVRLEFLMKRWL